jgi:hypothetical protein
MGFAGLRTPLSPHNNRGSGCGDRAGNGAAFGRSWQRRPRRTQGHSVLLPDTTLTACWRCSAKCSKPSTGLNPRCRSTVSSAYCAGRRAPVAHCVRSSAPDPRGRLRRARSVACTPVFARQCEQALWSGFCSGQAGDGIDRLEVLLAAHDTPAGQAADLGQAGPARRQVLGYAGGGLQPAGLDPAVALIECLGLLEVRRRRPFR